MDKLFVFIFLLFSITSFDTVGSAPAILKCKSESGRTFFNAQIQDFDGDLEKAELIIDGVKLDFNESQTSHVVFDPNNGIYTLLIESKSKSDLSNYKFLKIWALPKSFKKIKETSSEMIYQFKARLISTESRKNKDSQTPEIGLICELSYKI